MAKNNKAENVPMLHENHRERLKDRFLKEGLTNFEKHNALELLLFYGIPRIDTNEIAHELINNYRSFAAVFDANYDDLIKQKHISKNVAVLIKLIPALANMYMVDKNERYTMFNTLHSMGEYFVKYFFGETREIMALMILNNKLEMIDCVKIAEGDVNQSSVSIRRIVEECIFKNAACVVLAHNHPDGSLLPSDSDKDITRRINRSLSDLNITLAEHLVIAGNNYITIINRLVDPHKKFNGVEAFDKAKDDML